MFLVQLLFTENKDRAAGALDGHKAWLEEGFADGVFLLAGGLAGARGGFVLARGATNGVTREDLEARLATDPFLTEGVVTEEITELSPAKADDRLAFLLEK